MSETFHVHDVLGDLAAIRAILRQRAQRIQDVGGDATVTESHLAALDATERFLCGQCDVNQLQARLTDCVADGRWRLARAEVFKMMCG